MGLPGPGWTKVANRHKKATSRWLMRGASLKDSGYSAPAMTIRLMALVTWAIEQPISVAISFAFIPVP